MGQPVKIKVEMTVDLDVEAWAAEFGEDVKDRQATRDDFLSWVNAHLSQTTYAEEGLYEITRFAR